MNKSYLFCKFTFPGKKGNKKLNIPSQAPDTIYVWTENLANNINSIIKLGYKHSENCEKCKQKESSS